MYYFRCDVVQLSFLLNLQSISEPNVDAAQTNITERRSNSPELHMCTHFSDSNENYSRVSQQKCESAISGQCVDVTKSVPLASHAIQQINPETHDFRSAHAL